EPAPSLIAPAALRRIVAVPAKIASPAPEPRVIPPRLASVTSLPVALKAPLVEAPPLVVVMPAVTANKAASVGSTVTLAIVNNAALSANFTRPPATELLAAKVVTALAAVSVILPAVVR